MARPAPNVAGRASERHAVERLLDAGRRGRSGSLVVAGEAGIGKSTLLAYAVARAAGYRVLRAVGREAEAALPFAGLSDLFSGVLAHLDELPPPQAAALAGALALAPPVAGDRFTVAAATLGLLAAVAERQPVLVAIDDAQWLDAASREALLFATRRLGDEGVVVLLAIRDDEGDSDEWSGLDSVRLTGLDPGESAVLLGEATGRPVAPAVAARLCAATHGNPLAMLEIARRLSDQQIAGATPLGELPAGTTVEAAFRRRLGALPAQARRALVVAAAGESLSVGEILAACVLLGLRAEDLAAARAQGVIEAEDDRIVFLHPLMRRAAYDGAPDDQRRAAHRALASVLHATARERAAWHLGQAAGSPEEVASAALARSAWGAAQRNAPAIAALLAERAAELAVGAEQRERLFLGAAQQWQLAGSSERSLASLEHVRVGDDVDARRRADAQHLRAAAQASQGEVPAAARLLVDEATAVESADPLKAAEMLVDACGLLWLSGPVREALSVALRCAAIGDRLSEHRAVFATMTLGTSLVLCGQAEAGRALILEGTAQPGAGMPLVLRGAQAFGLLWLDETRRAEEYIDELCAAAREANAPSQLCPALVRRSYVRYRLGRLSAAHADASESLRLAQETKQHLFVFYSLAVLALVEAVRGDDVATAHASHAAELAEAHDVGAVRCFALAALGHAALAVRRFEAAIPPLETIERLFVSWGVRHPAIVYSTPDLIEACVRLGRYGEARDRLDELTGQASANASRSALAGAYRCEGMLASPERCDAWFERALAMHEQVPLPFDRARTQLSYGEHLRRARRKTDARVQLEAARATFEQIGARPWADSARAELDALGIRAPKSPPNASRSLTPQELRVAISVGRGSSNREAGAELFLSPKTIEAHLSRIYRKLGIRSRSELIALLARDGTLLPEEADGAGELPRE